MTTVSSDRPLNDPSDDVLGYAPFAKQLAHTLLRNSPADGFVIAIYGAWGTGKSTALNFIVRYVEDDPDADKPIIIRFNPWWFASGEDLTRRFFIQFETAVFAARSTKKKLKSALGKFVAVMAEVPIKKVQATAKVAGAALGVIPDADVVKLKEELTAELAKEALRIVVIMDDIDRKLPDEMRQLFRLIKAVADFPNVTYVLAFDREVAAHAFEEMHAGRGEAYLEKIVQAPFELPPPDRTQLQALLLKRIGEVIGEIPDSEFDNVYWGNLFIDGIDPFVTKPRDIVRLVNALTVTFPALKGEVNFADFVAIEALRVFCPRAYEVVRSNMDEFAGATPTWRAGQDEKGRALAFHETWMSSLGEQKAHIKRLLLRLFPKLDSVWGNTFYVVDSMRDWRRARRVCATEVFPIYFRFSLGPGAISNAEFAATISEDRLPMLAQRLRELAGVALPDGSTRARELLNRLNDYARDEAIPLGASAPAIMLALFDAGDDVVRADPAAPGPLLVDDESRVHFILRNLLKRLPASERLSNLKKLVAGGRALGVIVRTVSRLGADLGRYGAKASRPDDQLLTSLEVEELEGLVKERLAEAAKDGALVSVPALVQTLNLWRRLGDNGLAVSWVNRETANDSVLLRMLAEFVGWQHSFGMGDRAARRTPTLRLENIEVFFNLDTLVPRLRQLLGKPGWTGLERTAMELVIQQYEPRLSGCTSRST